MNKCPFNFDLEVRHRIRVIPYAPYIRFNACGMYDYIALLSKYSYHLLYIFDYISLFFIFFSVLKNNVLKRNSNGKHRTTFNNSV